MVVGRTVNNRKCCLCRAKKEGNNLDKQKTKKA
jgi:hypothetical protein